MNAENLEEMDDEEERDTPVEEAPASGAWGENDVPAGEPVRGAWGENDTPVGEPTQGAWGENDTPVETAAKNKPEAEGFVGSAVRAAKHAAIPTAAGVAGFLPGAAIGSLAGPVGAIVGGLISGLATNVLARSVQENLMKRFGWGDEEQQQANEEAHPYATLTGELATGLPFFGVGGGPQLVTRALSGGIMTATDLYSTGDPLHALAAGAGGAAMGGKMTKLGETVGGSSRPLIEKFSTKLARNVQDYFNTAGGEKPNAEGGDPTTTAGLQRNVLQRGRSGRPIETEPFNTGADDAILEAGAAKATNEGRFRAGRPDEAEDKLGKDQDKDGVQTAGDDTPSADAAPGVAEPAVPVNKYKTAATIGNEYHGEGSNRLYGKVQSTAELHVIPEDGVAPDIQTAIRGEPITQQAQQEPPPEAPPPEEPPGKPGGSGEPLPPLTKGELPSAEELLAGKPAPEEVAPTAPEVAPTAPEVAPNPLKRGPEVTPEESNRLRMAMQRQARQGMVEPGAEEAGSRARAKAQLEEQEARTQQAKVEQTAEALKGGEPEPGHLTNLKRFLGFDMSPASRLGKLALRQAQGEGYWEKQQAFDRISNKMRAMLNKMAPDEQRKLVNWAQGGDKFPDWKPSPEHEEAANAWRKGFQQAQDLFQSLPKYAQMDFWANDKYLPGMYKNPEKAAEFFSNWRGKGSAGSTKAKKFPTYEDAIEAGHEPLTSNPIELHDRYWEGLHHLYATNKLLQNLKDRSLISWVSPKVKGATGSPEPMVTGIPEGWAPLEGWAKNGQGQTAYAPRELSSLLNNFYSNGMRGEYKNLYDFARRAQNNWTMLELGLNVYHGFTEIGEAIGSGMAKGVTQAASGDLAGAAKSVSTAVANPYTYYKAGNEALNKLKAGEKSGIYKFLRNANIKPIGLSSSPDVEMSKMGSYYDAHVRGELKGQLRDEIRQIVGEKDWKAGAMFLPNQISRVMQTMAQPLFQHIIPRMKLGAQVDMVKEYIAKNPGASDDQIQLAVNKIVDSMDNRMGEMVRDNLTVNKSLQDAGYLALRSFSWTIGGSIREIAGGALSGISGALKGQNRLSLKSPHYDPRVAYAIAFPMTIAFMNGIYQTLRTGQLPSDPRDLIYPRTGGTAPGVGGKGKVDERVMLPGYHKDLVGYGAHPLQEITGKAAGLWTELWQQMHNKDWRDKPIVRPNASVWENMQDRLAHLATGMTPISAKSIAKGQKKGSAISPVETALGFRPPGNWFQDPKGTAKSAEKREKAAWKSKLKLEKKEKGQYEGR